jgi:phenylacetate-CoA ligase
MIKKLLTKTLYHGFDLVNKGRLSHLYAEARKHNLATGSRAEELQSYLNKWGFNPVIEENGLMVKKDVIAATKLVDQNSIYSWAYTGGSFGEPLKMPYSKRRDLIRTGTFRHFNEIGGYALGSSFAIIRAKEKGKLIKFLRNETIIIPADVSEEKLIRDIELMKQNNVHTLMGYPTVMYELALLLRKRHELKDGLNIQSLISTSEMLEQEKREFVHGVFNCNFIDRYSNEEVGLIGQQTKFNEDYKLNRYGVYVEVLDPVTLKPVNTGEEGKVIVTDTNNDLVPIIRYDTGDLAIAGEYVNGHLTTIKKVIGRTSDKLTDTGGNPISSLALGPLIYKPLANASLNLQFQLIQHDAINYNLKLKIDEKEFPQDVKTAIMANLQEKLGQDAKIKQDFVNDILPLPSGKRPVYLNLNKPNKSV